MTTMMTTQVFVVIADLMKVLWRRQRSKVVPRKNTKKCAGVSETGRKKGPGRKNFAIAPNYLEDQDYLIVVAFLSVIFDPIRGVGQKSENVWIRVHDKCCLLQQKELGSDTYTNNKDFDRTEVEEENQ
jgi:hypothetical protein